jgi:hypothetical protein
LGGTQRSRRTQSTSPLCWYRRLIERWRETVTIPWLGSILLGMGGAFLAFEAHSAGAISFSAPAVGGEEERIFDEVAAEVGLHFRHDPGATGEFYLPEIMGAGVALFDFDQDGDLDIYLVQGERLAPAQGPTSPPSSARTPGNRLFRNELIPTGKLRFTDVTRTSGAGTTHYGMGVATGDYDQDGDLDLYVTAFGRNVLLQNRGDGTFRDVTESAGVGDTRWGTSATFLDYDRDGDLDLYVCNYVDFTVAGNKQCLAPTGELDYCAPSAYRPVSDRLFQNEGGGRFRDVTIESGIGKVAGPALGVVCADFNQDGWIDLYIANDGAANHLWLNRRDGTFEEGGLLAGAAYAADGMARAGMGIAAEDFDRDGDIDILVTNLTRQGSTLYRNLSEGGEALFEDATIDVQLAQPTFLSTGFGVSWLDYDLDGWLDLFMANGAVTRLPGLRGEAYPFHQRNQLFRQVSTPQGTFLQEVTLRAGAALALSEVSRGVAIGDLDNDGAPDLVVTNNYGPVRLLLNRRLRQATAAPQPGWVRVELEGQGALGAQVAVLVPGEPPRWRRAHTDGSYLSANDPRLLFGLGQVKRIDGIGVLWPDGNRERWAAPTLNRAYRLRRGTGTSWK